MIERIDISNFGSFRDLVWRDSIRDQYGNVLKFTRLNILYGRNYSGKTTLSRILRSLEERRFPDKYDTPPPRFTITTDKGTVDQDTIECHDLVIRVYNKDFVDDHLSFLRSHDGNITPFAIIGRGKKEIKDQIDELEGLLGSIEKKNGLRYRLDRKRVHSETKNAAVIEAKNDLEAKLINKANRQPGGIKHNPIYRNPNYNIRSIKADIERVRNDAFKPLSEEHRHRLKQLLRETPLPHIDTRLEFMPRRLYETAKSLLAKKISPTRPIQELLNDAVLQAWVKEGIEHHRDKRSTCAFCGQTLPADIWARLDVHFSRESEKLIERVGQHITAIETEIEKAESIFSLNKADFYSSTWGRIKQYRKHLQRELGIYVSQLEQIKLALQAKQDNIFLTQGLLEPVDNTAWIQGYIDQINDQIIQNNQRTHSLADEQEKARTKLRLTEIAQFIIDIDLDTIENHIDDLESLAKEAQSEFKKLSGEVQSLEEELQNLRGRLRDEDQGAEKVKEYLNHSFGTKKLRLVAVDDPENGANFKILRNDEPAYNLSEGECTLVAFCYFLAKLEEAETAGKDVIVFIDDPVSSLDSNHIFFIFSLIESVLARPITRPDGSKEYRYHQMFIATHNLDFLKYLKRLTHRGQGELAHFIVEDCAGQSRLMPMPAYLKKYITEFNYLFCEIYKCRNAENVKDNHECFYNFGNNLRKFLEAFLFYRYPCRDNFAEKLKRFFGEDQTATALAVRVGHELSHLEEILDRGGRPIDTSIIPTLANFVLDKIYEKDPDQFNALLKSIGEPPREG